MNVKHLNTIEHNNILLNRRHSQSIRMITKLTKCPRKKKKRKEKKGNRDPFSVFFSSTTKTKFTADGNNYCDIIVYTVYTDVG